MAHKTMLLAAAVLAVAFAGCISGEDGGNGTASSSTSTTGGVSVGGNVTIGSNSTTSGSSNMTNTTDPANDTAPMDAQVTLQGNQFVNSTVTIRAGGTVTWTHDDGSTAHTVTADDESFDSSPNCSPPLTLIGDCLGSGDTFSQTFSTPGTYTYHCKVHSSMTGTVTVVA